MRARVGDLLFFCELDMWIRKKRGRYKTEALMAARYFGREIDLNDWEKIWALLDEWEIEVYDIGRENDASTGIRQKVSGSG